MKPNTKYQVKISPTAAKDLKEIILYIARKNPTAAKKFADMIRSKINSILGVNPYLCPAVTEYIALQSSDYRRLVLNKNFSVLFIVSGQLVEVRYIMHNRQDFNCLV